MEIYDILDRDSCSIDMQARTKLECLHGLAALAAKSSRIDGLTEDSVYQALAERESQGSTGFGNEVAIPHARIPGMKDFLLYIAIFPKGVDFDAIDKKKVKIIFVILGPPEAVTEHLKILATVSRAIGHTNVKHELQQAPTITALYEAFLRNTDSTRAKAAEKRRSKLVIVNLYNQDILYSVLEVFIEEGIEGATILDSAGMGRYISNTPLFADFIGFMRADRQQSQTILTLVPEDRVDELIDHIERVTGDFDTQQGAMIMVLDVALVRGSMAMI